MVPSSAKVPCITGKMMSTLMEFSEVAGLWSDWNGTSESAAGTGGTIIASPEASTAATEVAAGSPARKCLSSACLPRSRFSACEEVTQRPSLVMPMGTTSYFSLSIASSTDAADSSEISCSPLRPPKRTPTRSFFIDRCVSCSEDLFPKHRHRQLHRQHSSSVVFVDDGIHFDDLKAGHAAVVGD